MPIFYSPWLVVPVKNQRQTGFLFPELGSSENNGFTFNLPFFWNISDSTDLTIYTEYMVNRGYMPGLELRYVKSETDKGLVMANYLYLQGERAVTGRCEIRFRQAAELGVKLQLEGELLERKGRKAVMHGRVLHPDSGKVLAEATGTFVIVAG